MLARMTVVLTTVALAALPSATPAQRAPVPVPPLEELEAAARRDSLDADARFRLARRYCRLERFDDEERELRAVIATDPRYAAAYLWLADLPYDRRAKLWQERRRGRVPPALEPAVAESDALFRRAFLIDPMVDFRVMGAEPVAENLLILPDYGRHTTAFLLRLGLAAFGATRYELSHSALTMWVDREYAGRPRDSVPDFLFWYRGLAAAHGRAYNVVIGDFQVLLDRALHSERADTLVRIPLGTNDYRYVLGVLHQTWGKPADAMRLFQEALANDLGLYMGHVRLAQLFREYKMWDRAVEEARRAIETNPDDATALLELGVILREAGLTAEAEATLRQAAPANPRDPRPVFELGVVHEGLAQPAAAREAFARFISMAPASRYGREITDAKKRLAALPDQGGTR